ncbi:nitroreductase [Paenibacillus psychroresistens]|uniref:Nitroreductase n=1 Tax=Paenibacillus psychroresistens TaxID=1778678 RepID=A0A6B8RK09_9BACL|nr:nitroreductase family protein [Paenibacillus psychroresistens]QGQ96359.1 nitroreductase [Paenibacillus psychroresistens]
MSSIEKQAFHPALDLLEVVKNNREPEHEVSPLFLNRWSPRAYTDQKVPDAELNQLLEAARWAPSSNNQQPWRFYVANTEAKLEVFRQFIVPFNLSWMSQVPQLILLGSAKLTPKGDPNGAHAFDAGSAWSHIALQATLLGLSSHAIGGFDSNKARELLNVPADIDLHAVIVIGYQGDKATLSEALQEREKPNQRNPLSASIVEWNA